MTQNNARVWSSYQNAIFKDMSEGKGNTVIRAYAGCAKTSTCVEGLIRLPSNLQIIVMAFNTGIRDELTAFLKDYGNILVKSFHQVGLSLAGRRFPGIRVDNQKGYRCAEKALDAHFGDKWTRDMVRDVYQLASYGKNTQASAGDLVSVAYLKGYGDDDSETYTPEIVADLAVKAMEHAANDTKTLDFDDMVWFPSKFNLLNHKYDLVVVDETQDCNASQLWIVKHSAKLKRGRIIAVGDEHQAIYGFRGADTQAIPRMIRELSAKVLPLSITYRCPKSVVAMAQVYVPDYQAHAEAPEGLIVKSNLPDLFANARPGDFVISRKNAPLTRICLGLLKAGTPACIAGKNEIGASLIKLLEKAKTDDLDQALGFLAKFADKECARLEARNQDKQAELLRDKVEAIEALAEGETTVKGFVRKVETLFVEIKDEAGKEVRLRRPMVVCTSTHKAKGLERDRVFLLERTFSDKGVEERNLRYVAMTRTKRELHLVEGEV
ncbi:hypothetical protein A3F38_00590 [Candidatus Saccharibacteria bacterium RIFCSPHIGHO2_12_FULL_48_21]|nr:MAG: hypothetical protein A3F38_00590 [Candidatus Saccharibacteria bacterium RIFCSPHIGHO2_12_FULL_48_21]